MEIEHQSQSGPGSNQLDKLDGGPQSLKNIIETLELTLKLLENIANNPQEEKFYKVKTTNQRISEIIFSRWPEAGYYFHETGFYQSNEFFIFNPSKLGELLAGISILRERLKISYDIYAETDEGIYEKQQQEIAIQKQIQLEEYQKQARQAASQERVLHIQGSSDFQAKVLSSNQPVIVDFYADWCPPCKKLALLFDQEIQNEGNWILAKVKSDNPANQQVSASHNISGIPAIFLYYKGQILNQFSFTGFNPGALQKMIQKAASLV